jgi:drug/metabolite transporter (DMT)-like permease
MPQRLQGIFALLIVTLVWGTTFPAMKELSAYFSATAIIFLRFCLAALLLAPFLRRATREDLRAGFVLGCLLFLCFLLQVGALGMTGSNRVAFVTGLNVLVVPLIGLGIGRLPEGRIVGAIALALLGLFLMCWDGGSWSAGDTWALGSALLFGGYVVLLERYSRTASRPVRMTAAQIATVALCAGLWLLTGSGPATHAGEIPGAGSLAEGLRLHGANLVYLGVVATAAIISLQTWGQRHTNANEAAVVYAFEPACAAIAAYFWIGETMTARSLAGAVLLIGGIVVSQWQPRPAAPVAS